MGLVLLILFLVALVFSTAIAYLFEVLRLGFAGQSWKQAMMLQEPPRPTQREIREKVIKEFEEWHDSLCLDPSAFHYQSEKQFARLAWLASRGWIDSADQRED